MKKRYVMNNNRDFFILDNNKSYFRIIFKAVFFVAIIACFYVDGAISPMFKIFITLFNIMIFIIRQD